MTQVQKIEQVEIIQNKYIGKEEKIWETHTSQIGKNSPDEMKAYVHAKKEAARVAKQTMKKQMGEKSKFPDMNKFDSVEFSKWLSEEKIDINSPELDVEDFESFLEKVRAKSAQALQEEGNEAHAFEQALSQGLAATKIAGDALNALQPVELHAVGMPSFNTTPSQVYNPSLNPTPSQSYNPFEHTQSGWNSVDTSPDDSIVMDIPDVEVKTQRSVIQTSEIPVRSFHKTETPVVVPQQVKGTMGDSPVVPVVVPVTVSSEPVQSAETPTRLVDISDDALIISDDDEGEFVSASDNLAFIPDDDVLKHSVTQTVDALPTAQPVAQTEDILPTVQPVAQSEDALLTVQPVAQSENILPTSQPVAQSEDISPPVTQDIFDKSVDFITDDSANGFETFVSTDSDAYEHLNANEIEETSLEMDNVCETDVTQVCGINNIEVIDVPPSFNEVLPPLSALEDASLVIQAPPGFKDVPQALEAPTVHDDAPSIFEDVQSDIESPTVIENVPSVIEAPSIFEDVPSVIESHTVPEDIPPVIEAPSIFEGVPSVIESPIVLEDVPSVLEVSSVIEDVPSVLEASIILPVVTSQTPVIISSDELVTEEPLNDNSEMIEIKPDTIDDNMFKIADSPDTIDDNLFTIADDPMTVADNPVTIADDPVTIADDPVTIADDPVTTTYNPIIVDDDPVTIVDNPVTIDDNPITIVDNTENIATDLNPIITDCINDHVTNKIDTLLTNEMDNPMIENGTDVIKTNGIDSTVTSGIDPPLTNGTENHVTNGIDIPLTNGADGITNGIDIHLTNGIETPVTNGIHVTNGINTSLTIDPTKTDTDKPVPIIIDVQSLKTITPTPIIQKSPVTGVNAMDVFDDSLNGDDDDDFGDFGDEFVSANTDDAFEDFLT